MLEVAHAFGRPDVEQFLDEIAADQLDEWAAYFALRPPGFRATSMMTARLAWAAVQPHTKRRVAEADFALQPCSGVHDNRAQRARFEALSIREGITNGR